MGDTSGQLWSGGSDVQLDRLHAPLASCPDDDLVEGGGGSRHSYYSQVELGNMFVEVMKFKNYSS